MTAAIKTPEITLKQAQKLWEQLKQHFINAERVMEEIVETRAWEAMGYGTFAEAWVAQGLNDITFATEIRPHVVYAMLDSGLTAADVALQVKGAGPSTVESLARQKANGVPAKHASSSSRWHNKEGDTVVREHLRKKPSAPTTLHLEIGPTKLKRYKRIADKYGMTVEEIALQAITEKFRELS